MSGLRDSFPPDHISRMMTNARCNDPALAGEALIELADYTRTTAALELPLAFRPEPLLRQAMEIGSIGCQLQAADRLSALLLEQDRTAEAEHICETTLALPHADEAPDVIANMAALYGSDFGRPTAEVRGLYERALFADEVRSDNLALAGLRDFVLLKMGLLELEAGNFNKAADHFIECARDDEADYAGPAHYYLGQIGMLQGDVMTAELAFIRGAESLDPMTSADSANALVELYLEQGSETAAVRWLYELQETAPTDEEREAARATLTRLDKQP